MNAIAKYCMAALIALTLASSHLLDGPSELDTAEATAASLRDAIAQAQHERPDLWTAETKARAQAAIPIAARGDRQ